MTVIYVRCHPAPIEMEPRLLAVLTEITPTVQLLPRDGALLSVGGALRYWKRTPEQLTDLVQTRVLAQAGLTTAVGGGPTRMIATMAVNTCAPGQARLIAADEALGFLHRQAVRALPGVGPVLERTLGQYGIATVGDLAALPMGTVQRIAGATLGRQLHERAARGFDPRPIAPAALAASTSATRRFPRDELDPVQRRRALLALACELGTVLRTRRAVAIRLTLSVQYADASHSTRSRTLGEPTAHPPVLRDLAYQLHDGLGLQRARVRALTVAADLADDRCTAHQLTLDPGDEQRRRIEAVIGRTEIRYGPGALAPAALATTPPAGAR
ncbi:DNA polymerase Y family protein [Streptomyces melanogenes]|uniref:DNA polymerase Y family protein n=1 Tax=Streptomyces melanogenes TaxID=67326 RepID=UPI00167C6793|nr:hypothetical protein [Streptomyces melanogenes]GGP80021.1 hypothetical protein GCM10010278_68040 [Streptomyces melanogenes]